MVNFYTPVLKYVAVLVYCMLRRFLVTKGERGTPESRKKDERMAKEARKGKRMGGTNFVRKDKRTERRKDISDEGK